MYDMDSLKLALLALLGNGGMGMVVSYVWSRIQCAYPWAEGLDRDAKVGMLAILSFVLVQVPVWFGVFMLILPAPLTLREWVSISFSYSTIAFTAATATYNVVKARVERLRAERMKPFLQVKPRDTDWNCPEM